MMPAQIVKAEVIPWDKARDLWVVALDYSDQRLECYFVGDREQAEEARKRQKVTSRGKRP